MKGRENLPYPDGEVMGKNEEYAAWLMPLFAGRGSKMTAVWQYLYQYWLTLDEYPALAMLFEEIAVDEEQHMRLLGEIITALGGDPQLRVGKGYYWTGEFVRPAESVLDYLKANILAEKNAIAEFNRRLKLIDDPYIREVLARILADEQSHLEALVDAEEKFASYGR